MVQRLIGAAKAQARLTKMSRTFALALGAVAIALLLLDLALWVYFIRWAAK